MEFNQGTGDSDADVKVFLDRLKTIADQLDAALYDAKRLYRTEPSADTPADRAA